MATTVTYKGNTLTTVDNNTKTLKTAGKYMEGDVVLTDVITLNKLYFDKENITPSAGDVYVNIESSTAAASTVETQTMLLNGYDTENISWAEATSKNITNAYTDTSSNTYATISLKSGENSETYVYFDIDKTDKPDSSYTLLKVQYKAKIGKSATSAEAPDIHVALALNGEEITASKETINTTSTATYTSPEIQITSWDDFYNLQFKVYGQRGTQSVRYARYIYLYGVEIIITYTTSAEYITTMTTEQYNGTTWEAKEFTDIFSIGLQIEV